MGFGTSRRLLKSNTRESPLQDGNGQQECQFDQRSGEQRLQSNEQTHHYFLDAGRCGVQSFAYILQAFCTNGMWDFTEYNC